MALRFEQTTYDTSSNLRNAFFGKGFDLSIKPLQTIYTSPQEMVLILGMTGEGLIRVTNNVGIFDVLDPNSEGLCRSYVLEELQHVLQQQITGYTNLQISQDERTKDWTYTILAGEGNRYTGQNQSQVEACAAAILLFVASSDSSLK